MKILELTLAILKPHIIQNPVALKEIRKIILTSGFKIVRSKTYKFSDKDAEIFYEEHKKKFFYNRLVTFMSSGPSDLYILARHNAIQDWRKLMGPTRIPLADIEAPNSIRGRFGLSDTRNAVHGSDSRESAIREIGLCFPDFKIEEWYAKYEPYFRENKVTFSEKDFVYFIADKDMPKTW